MINEEVEKDKLTKYQLLLQLKTLYKIADTLEQRIAKLEKVNAVTKEHGSLTESQYDDSTYTLNTGE